MKYQTPGSSEIASQVSTTITGFDIGIDNKRGIDHAAWAVLKYVYPDQNIPVLELSLNYSEEPEYHYRVGKELGALRDKGILMIGSGNIVHNLREISFDENAKPYSWVIEFDMIVKDYILNRKDRELINYESMGSLAKKAVPTNDHYLPLLYVIAQRGKNENVRFLTEVYQNASMAMRSFIVD